MGRKNFGWSPQVQMKNLGKETLEAQIKSDTRRSRTAIFSLNMEHKKLGEHTRNHFYKYPNTHKRLDKDKDFVGSIQADSFR